MAIPREEALAWWKERVEEERYAGERKELPSPPAEQYLIDEKLIALTPGRWGWVVVTPDMEDREAALRQNYWRLAGVLVSIYAPAAVERISAVRLFMGEASTPPLLHVSHASNASERRVEIAPGMAVALRPARKGGDGENGGARDAAPALATEDVEVDGVRLPVIAPARVLLSLTVTDIRDHRDLVLTWLQSLVVSRPELEAVYEADPRPVLLARIGQLARAVGNERLAEQIRRVSTMHQRSPISRAVTGVGAIGVPAYIVSQPSLREPWLDRFRAKLARAAEVTADVVRGEGLELSPASPGAVLEHARRAKAEDTYHSTTIEGYRITRGQVQAVLAGAPLDSPDRAETERLMALKGYAQAFERTLAAVSESAAGDGGPRLSEALALDLYVELWSPSVDAEIMSAMQLRGWRKDPVYIRGSAYVPPSPVKVPQLMRVWADTLNEMELDPVSRAAVAHWGFVHVHPFLDGNGRLSRLLMNLVLCGSGLPWTTIRAEERRDYFAALEAAHVAEDYEPFARFVASRAARALESW